MLWNNSAASAVLLEPTKLTGFNQTFALGTSGNQQVGWGYNTIAGHDEALLWSGTAASAVNLNPTGFGSSSANATNGFQQVGLAEVGASAPDHAVLWTGTADSWVDLQPFLPATGTWTDSDAYSIDTAGHVYGMADGTFNGVTGTFAVEWTVPVPEPAGGLVMLLLVATPLVSRGRRDGAPSDNGRPKT
jgi:hypothetical protein